MHTLLKKYSHACMSALVFCMHQLQALCKERTKIHWLVLIVCRDCSRLRCNRQQRGRAGGVWVGPEVGSTVQWQEVGDARAPLVASVLEQFGRMTALARETTTSLLTSTAYWGAQPGPPASSLNYAILTSLY